MNDGDKSLVVADRSIVDVAERECVDTKPLYYPMAKAAPSILCPDAFYNGMVAAWTGGNIGVISNSISKIWNSKEPDAEAVKVLCMQNNFVIDYAKTLYKPNCPDEWKERLRNLDRPKLPHFFIYAKGKTDRQVEQRGNGLVDRLYDYIQIYKFRFNAAALGEFDYKMLMFNGNIQYGEKEDNIVKHFRKLASDIYDANARSLHDDDGQYWLKIKNIRDALYAYGTKQYVVDVLVRGLFHEHNVRKKSAFWECFGDVVYDNLEMNLPVNTKVCTGCGKRFKADRNKQLCGACDSKKTAAIQLFKAKCVQCGDEFTTRNRSSAVCPVCSMNRSGQKTCVDCGAVLDIKSNRGRPSTRCQCCQQARNREKTRVWKIKQYG